MTMAAVVAVIVVRRRFVVQGITIVAKLMVVSAIVAVHGRGVEMSVQGMAGRPCGLEGDEQHEADQKDTAHGAQW